MELTLPNRLQRKSCLHGATTIALVTMAALNAAGADVRAFNNRLSGVPAANPEVISDNILSPEFTAGLVAQGANLLENPSGLITGFGNLRNGNRTEPDENIYLILDHNPGGPTPGFDYGWHFLFQGHEMLNGTTNQAYLTRINLDVASPDHRITLLTPVDAMSGLTGFNSIDGSTWDPFSRTLLFTQEAGNLIGTGTGGVIEVGADFDTNTGAGAGLRTLYGSMGRGGFEGIHPDDRGNIWIVEDVGGTTLMNQPNGLGDFGRNPNSFVFRFVPTNPADLSQGKLQALQVSINGSPVTFVAVDVAHPTGDVLSNNQLLLHTVGASYPVSWVTVHDTAVNGTAPFDASAAAKAASATPFKRPENGQFQPGSKFQTFFFDITGDTDFRAGRQPALAARGAYGGIFRVDLDATRETGVISLVVLGDQDHAAFDNLTFADAKDTILVAEDRGDTLHDQLNRLDSVWAYKLVNGNPAGTTVSRFIALGQDSVAGMLGAEDNEPTGLHMSEGDSTINGLIGTTEFKKGSARLFITQQHGQNNLFEVFPID